MKKTIFSLSIIVISLWGVTFANSELQDAITWMYNNSLTSFSKIQDFNGEGELTREQASKFFVQFSKSILKKEVDTKQIVNLKDIIKADKTLQSFIKESNQLGLFKGTNGNFNPLNKLTRAQAIAVIIRANNGLQNEDGGKRYTKYYDISNEYGIISGLGFDFSTLDSINIKRKEIAIMLYRLGNLTTNTQSSTTPSNTIQTIDTAAIITVKCTKDRPDDFSMRSYCINNQNDALEKLKEVKPNYVDDKSYSTIITKCAKDRPDDFSMRAYCISNQYDGVKEIQLPKPSDIDNSSYSTILTKCEKDRLNDFSMRAYCIQNQYDGVRSLNK